MHHHSYQGPPTQSNAPATHFQSYQTQPRPTETYARNPSQPFGVPASPHFSSFGARTQQPNVVIGAPPHGNNPYNQNRQRAETYNGSRQNSDDNYGPAAYGQSDETAQGAYGPSKFKKYNSSRYQKQSTGGSMRTFESGSSAQSICPSVESKKRQNIICRFFNSAAGCRRGEQCHFKHEKTEKNDKDYDICWNFNTVYGCTNPNCRWSHIPCSQVREHPFDSRMKCDPVYAQKHIAKEREKLQLKQEQSSEDNDRKVAESDEHLPTELSNKFETHQVPATGYTENEAIEKLALDMKHCSIEEKKQVESTSAHITNFEDKKEENPTVETAI